jgi:hypothetical protein
VASEAVGSASETDRLEAMSGVARALLEENKR